VKLAEKSVCPLRFFREQGFAQFEASPLESQQKNTTGDHHNT
jgi:hypothetical protein